MRIVSLLFVLLLINTSCKDEKKGSQEKDTIIFEVENEDLKEKEQIKDLNSFLVSTNKEYSIPVEKEIIDGLTINDVSTYRDTTDALNFVFSLEKPTITINELKKHRLNLRITPFESEYNLLREESIKNNLLYDSWFSNLEIRETNSKYFIVFPVKTPISAFKNLSILVYNQETKSYLENRITIDYELNKFLLYEELINTYPLQGVLGGEFEVESLKIYRNEGAKSFYLAYKLSKNYPDELFENKRLMVNIYPTEGELDLLREDSKERQLEYDSWYSDLEIKSAKDYKYIWAFIPSDVLDLKLIKTYIYDNIQKRFVGLPVDLGDVSIEFNN